MRGSFEIITSLQYEVKTLERRLAAFESGEKYVTMKEEHEKELRFLLRIIKKLRKELADARYELKRSRKLWYEASDDMQDAYEKKIGRLKKELVHFKLWFCAPGVPCTCPAIPEGQLRE